MASTKVKAIVLGGTNVKEKDRIINVYSLEQGKLSLSMKGVRGDKAKMKFAKEIFCFADFIFEERSALIVFPDGKANGKWMIKMEYFDAFPEL